MILLGFCHFQCLKVCCMETRQSLKGIRVKTKDELVERIYKYFEEINAEPVVYHWKYRLDEIEPSEEIQVDTLPLKKSS